LDHVAPWCGHCKKSAPEFEKAAEILNGIVRVGAVNMDEERKAGEPYNIQGYPTIKFFAKNKKSPLTFESNQRTFDKFVEYSVQQLKDEVKSRSNAQEDDEL
jgi:protein disulfide-isomerase A6